MVDNTFVFYRGKAYKTRMADRLVEADLDLKDRDEERDELEKLKEEIFSGKYDNPTQEFERQKQEMEERYKPKIIIDVNMEEVQPREPEYQREKVRDNDRARARERRLVQKVKDKTGREFSNIDAEPIDSDSSGGHNFSPSNNRGGSDSRDGMDDDMSRNSLLSNSNTPTTPNSPSGNQNSGGGTTGIGMGFSLSLNKKRKIDPKSAFSMDDDGEEANGPTKKKLVPLGELQ
jgi:RNA-binding protein 25